MYGESYSAYKNSEDRRTQSAHYMGNNPCIILKIKAF